MNIWSYCFIHHLWHGHVPCIRIVLENSMTLVRHLNLYLFHLNFFHNSPRSCFSDYFNLGRLIRYQNLFAAMLPFCCPVSFCWWLASRWTEAPTRSLRWSVLEFGCRWTGRRVSERSEWSWWRLGLKRWQPSILRDWTRLQPGLNLASCSRDQLFGSLEWFFRWPFSISKFEFVLLFGL